MTIQANRLTQSAEKPGKRLYYLDYLKLVLTVLVIAHHASQAYAPKATAWPVMNPTRSTVLFPITTVNAAFFMGLFFLIAGYFVPGAYDRKGASAFLKPRFIRLGTPAIFFAVFVFGPIQYFLMGGGLSLTAFIRHLYQGGWLKTRLHVNAL